MATMPKKPFCPICEKPMPGSSTHGAEWPSFPFCSKKCQLVDLGRWMNGSHAEKLHAALSGDVPNSVQPDEE